MDDLAAFNAFPGRTVLLDGFGRTRLANDLHAMLRVYRLEGSCRPHYVLPRRCAKACGARPRPR